MKKNDLYTTIFEDDYILAINKKSGLLVAPDRFDKDALCLQNILKEKYKDIFTVHRIDKDTSGVVLFAKTAQMHKDLCTLFESQKIKKTYHCLIHSRPQQDTFIVDLPLLQEADNRHRTVVNLKKGKKSITEFSLLATCGPYSWLCCRPKTGRTHQIRAHLKAKGLYIVCDPLYSGNQRPIFLSDLKKKWQGDILTQRPLLKRLALHAYKIEFLHPATNLILQITATYSKDLEATRYQLQKLFNESPI